MFGVFGLLSLLILLVPRGVSGPKEPRHSLYFIWLCHQNRGRGEGRADPCREKCLVDIFPPSPCLAGTVTLSHRGENEKSTSDGIVCNPGRRHCGL